MLTDSDAPGGCWTRNFLELITEISVVVEYPRKMVLDDISHKLYIFGSTFYPYSMRKVEMLHAE